MPSFMDRLNAGLLGPTTNYGGLIDQASQDQARQQAQAAMYAQLLQAGGYSPQRTTLGQAIGGAMQAGQAAQNNGLQQALQAQLMKSQIARNERGDLPDAVRQFQYAQQNGYTGSFEEWKKLTQQEAQPTAPIQEYNLYSSQETAAGRKPMDYQAWIERRAALNVGAPYAPGEQGGAKGAFDRRSGAFIPQTTLPQEADASRTISGAQAGGAATEKGAAERTQQFINAGQDAADAISTVRRGLELLDSVGTGGIDAAKLKATQLFGVTGADESELSANLGKAVLSQLRATFGAQFTEKEGQRLSEIEAGFGKSTEGNKRLLQQAEKILDRAARRGLDAAEKSGDTFSAEEIRKSLNFTLSPSAAPAVGTVKKGYRFKGGDPAKQENWELVK